MAPVRVGALSEAEEAGSKSLDPPRRFDEAWTYRKIGWKPHSGQDRVIAAGGVRNRVVTAGRRFGKSEIGGHRLVKEALDGALCQTRLKEIGKRREYWVVGPTYTDAEKEFRVLYNRLKRMGYEDKFDRPGTYNDPLGGNMHLSMWEGTFQVHCKSAKHPESLVGEGLSGAIFAEAAKLKEVIYTKYVRPTLADFDGWSLMTSTPEGKNWFYRMWQRGQDPLRRDWWSMRAPSWLNPYVYPLSATDDGIHAVRERMQRGIEVIPEEHGVDPEIAALVGDLTEEAFNQEIGALFTEFVGRVFKDFDEETHVASLEYDPAWSTYACCDYGFTNPSVWLLVQVDPHGERINVLDEVYERGLAADEFAARIIDRGLAPGSCIAFYPDPASPGDTRILEEKLKIRHRGGTGGELRWRLDAIRKSLKRILPHLPMEHADNRPKLMIDRKCVGLINDMQEYRYPERRSEVGDAPENPMKKDDHGPEALGRFFAGLEGTPDKVARRARQRRASVKR